MPLINATPASWYKPAERIVLDLDSVGYFVNAAQSPRVVFREGQPPNYYTYEFLLINPCHISPNRNRLYTDFDFYVTANQVCGARWGVKLLKQNGEVMTFKQKATLGSGRVLGEAQYVSTNGNNVYGQFHASPSDGDYRLVLTQESPSTRWQTWLYGKILYGYATPQYIAGVKVLIP